MIIAIISIVSINCGHGILQVLKLIAGAYVSLAVYDKIKDNLNTEIIGEFTSSLDNIRIFNLKGGIPRKWGIYERISKICKG